jgi:hypothetical protein
MKIAQKRAIFYADRERKLKKLDELGLLDQYKEFNKGKSHNTIEWFCRKNGIHL